MTVRTDDDAEYETIGMDAPHLQRYAEVTLEDGEVVIYDVENEGAWVQSASAIVLEFMA
jgi:hypothetical protein